MESIYLVIIVGVITAVYSQIKKNNRNTSAPPFLSNRSKKQEIAKRKIEKPEIRMTSPDQTLSQEKRERSESILRAGVSENKQLQSTDPTAKKNSPVYSADASEQHHLVDAIIWSEILGPPRSKNPHFTRKNN